MFSLPFYQTEWNGIDLKAIQAETGVACNQLPSATFYERYYQRLSLKGQAFSAGWLDKKEKQSQWLRVQIERYGGQQSHVLSVGAGTGIIEKPLIQDGYKVDLQDFQSASFASLGVDQLTNCFSCPLADIGKTYDIVFSSAVTYALSDDDLRILLSDIHAILNPGGVFVWLDASLSWYEVYSYWRNRQKLKTETVLWGYKRPLSLWRRLGASFSVMDQGYYNSDMEALPLTPFMGLPLNVTPTWQMMVLRK